VCNHGKVRASKVGCTPNNLAKLREVEFKEGGEWILDFYTRNSTKRMSEYT